MRARLSAAIALALLQSLTQPVVAGERSREPPPIRLPLTFIGQNPITPIIVDGVTVNAGVDTGGVEGASLSLSHAVIRRAGGIELAGKLVATGVSGRSRLMPRFRMSTVNIGGHTFRNMTVMQTAAPAGAGHPGGANSIGRRFLSQYFVVLDFPHRAIKLWPPDTRDVTRMGCGPTGIPMEPTAGRALPVSVFKTRDARLRLLFDTGATYSMIPKTAAEQLRLPTIARGPGPVRFYESTVLAAGAGGQDFGPLEFVILPLELPGDFQGMLGWNFFMHHVVCIDYRRREIFVR